MSTATETKPTTEIRPFGIEADHPRNADLLLQCIPNARLRSKLDPTRSVKNARNGEEYIPVDQARHLSQFPRVPGMQVHVNPRECSYTIVDPLFDDDAMCDRLERAMKVAANGAQVARVKGVAPQKGKLDKHRFKSLLREMFNLVAAGEASVCKGSCPSMDMIDAADGRYLLNPGSRVQNTQPTFEDDMDEWLDNHKRHGG